MSDSEISRLEAEARRARDMAHKAEQRLEDARRHKNEARRDALKPLVERAHAVMCRWNHTDGCGWGYERDDWSGHAHRRWLDHYDVLVNGSSHGGTRRTYKPETLAAVIDLVEEAKKRDPNAAWLIRNGMEP